MTRLGATRCANTAADVIDALVESGGHRERAAHALGAYDAKSLRTQMRRLGIAAATTPDGLLIITHYRTTP